VLYGPAEDHIVEFALRGLSLTAILLSLPGGNCRFEVGGVTNGVEGRLLDDDTAVDKAFKINKAELFEVFESINATDANYPQIFAFPRSCSDPGSNSGAHTTSR
jgi:hypothetical protein